MAIIMRSGLPDLYLDLLPALDEVFFMTHDVEVSGMQFYNTGPPIKGSFINVTTVSSFGSVPQKAESARASTDTIYQGFDKKFTPVTYELAYTISKEANDDQKIIQIGKNVKALGRSFVSTKEIHLAAPFNTGFDTATSADGQYIFSASHNLLPSGSQSNVLATDLSVTSLQVALNTYYAFTDYRGHLLHLTPGRLIVPTEGWWLAKEILGSPDRPDTSSRSINALYGEGITPVVYRYLTDPDSWYIGPADNSQHDLTYYEKDAFDTYADTDFWTNDLLYKGHTRYDLGLADWTGWLGSTGG